MLNGFTSLALIETFKPRVRTKKFKPNEPYGIKTKNPNDKRGGGIG